MGKQYLDKNVPPLERAKMLLKELTLGEKMAQVNCIFPFGETYDDIPMVPHGIRERVSVLSIMWICPIRQDIILDMGCLTLICVFGSAAIGGGN